MFVWIPYVLTPVSDAPVVGQNSNLVPELQQSGLIVTRSTSLFYEEYTAMYKEGRARAKINKSFFVIYRSKKAPFYKVGRVVEVFNGSNIRVELYHSEKKDGKENLYCKKKRGCGPVDVTRDNILYFNIVLNTSDKRIPAKVWKKMSSKLSKLRPNDVGTEQPCVH